MAWVSFTMEGSKERVTFNTANISAITECKGRDGTSRTLLEVRSGKDFYLAEQYESVIQTIKANQTRKS